MLFRTAATSAAILLGLAAAGALAGPGWNPDPVTDHIQPASADTMVGGEEPATGTGRAGDFGVSPEPGRFQVRETAVTIRLDDGASVGGLLREPVTDAGQGLAGIVFVHGAGTGKASDAFTEAATALASAGIVTLVPDKYLAHYTTRSRDYVEMAGDYQHSVDFLRRVPGVDPDRVGLYAESEGCWIAPVLMARDPRLAFEVWVSAPVVPPRQQAAFAMDNYLRNTDVPEGVFRAIPRAVGMRLPGGGFEYADFDVRPWLARQDAPIFMAYGAADPSMPMEQGVRQVLADTAAGGGDAPVTVRFYDGANHGINVSDEPLGDGVVPHGDGLHLHPGFARDVAAWVHGLPASATARPRIAGAQPAQLYLAEPVPQPHWYADGDVVLGIVIAAAVLILAGGVTLGANRAVRGAVARARAARGGAARPAPGLAPGLAAPLGVTAGVTVATAVGLVAYLLAVARLALDYEQNALVVQGGWIGVRLLGVVAAVAAAVLLLRCRAASWRVAALRVPGEPRTPDGGSAAPDADVRMPDAGNRVGPRLVTAAFWALAAGTVALGLVLAYWGVYQLGV
ncbi:alpha/beta hydrolase family protein [Myceligenerans indicum]|uniref:Alpha/beta hydrolase n=1 Tax=Myceligenerans indicum TaxID=2593663 RepID=A0ABS1LPG7_9MICO|nr:alpha/beta hydrolase [Myceligenerans indicum]MBL0887904.1 alpha/beta hydrolase [Myceligenerans indicum]